MNFKMADTRVSDECVKTIKSQIEEMAFHLNVKTGRKRKKTGEISFLVTRRAREMRDVRVVVFDVILRGTY